MAKWSAVLVLAFVAVVTCSVPAGVQINSMRSEVCDTCLWLVNTTELYLNNTETKRTIIEFLDAEVCTVLPGDMALQCQTLSTLLVPKVVEYLVNNFDSKTVCTDAGVCPSRANGVIDQFSCPVCEYVVNGTVEHALDPEWQDFARRQGRAICAVLQPDTQDYCHAQIDVLIKDADSVLVHVNSTATCRQLRLCGGNELWAPLLARMQTLLTLKRAVAAQGVVGSNSGYCEVCQIAVMEMAAIVADPNLQTQITAAVKSACSVTGQWQAQCSTYVDEYAPIVFNVALMYLKPEQMCQQIMHVCPATPAVVLS